MTNEHDTVDTGIAVLKESDDGQFRVRGVALGEDDVTHGASKQRVWWPRETLENAAESLVGTKIVDDSAHDIPEDGEVPTQPPVKSIVGEVTDAQYKPGVGVLYQGEIDDEDISSLVENGRIDVSPFVFRRLGEKDETRDAYRAEEIVKWRDLATVETGASEGASIEPAPETGAAAMASSALAEALASEFSAEEDDDEEEDAEDEETPNESAESDVEDAPADEPGSSGEDGGADKDDNSMDLTEDEEELIRESRTMDDPRVVSPDVEALYEEHESFDDPRIVEEDDYDALSERVDTVRGVLAEALSERTGMRQETAEALSIDALMGEFEDEDGDFDAEALVQEPETGSTDDAEEPEGGTDVGADALSDDEKEDVRSKLARADTLAGFGNNRSTKQAESLREEAAEMCGVDDYTEIDTEEL